MHGSKPGAGRGGVSRDFRPKGILKQIWDAFQNSKTGKKSDIAGEDILQYFSYHRRYQSVSVPPERWTEHLKSQGMDRDMLRRLAPMFGHYKGAEPFAPDFWTKSVAQQAQIIGKGMTIKRGMHKSHDPDYWREIMRDVFRMKNKEIPVARKSVYESDDIVALWTALSTQLQPYMDIIRAETSKEDYDPIDRDRGMGAVAGDWFASHAAGLEVADTGLRAGIKAHRAMSSKTRSSVGSSDEEPILTTSKRPPPKRRLEFGDDDADAPRQAGTIRPDISYHRLPAIPRGKLTASHEKCRVHACILVG